MDELLRPAENTSSAADAKPENPSTPPVANGWTRRFSRKRAADCQCGSDGNTCVCFSAWDPFV